MPSSLHFTGIGVRSESVADRPEGDRDQDHDDEEGDREGPVGHRAPHVRSSTRSLSSRWARSMYSPIRPLRACPRQLPQTLKVPAVSVASGLETLTCAM